MRRIATFSIILSFLGLSIVALVRAQGTVPADGENNPNPSVVAQLSDSQESPAAARPLFGGRINLPWARNGNRTTQAQPETTQPGPTLAPPPSEHGATTQSSESRLQRRLQALREGRPDDHAPRTAAVPRTLTTTTGPQPTPATPQTATEAAPQNVSPRLAPTPTEPPPAEAETALPQVAAEVMSDGEPSTLDASEVTTEHSAAGLPSILTRKNNRPLEKAETAPVEESAKPIEATPIKESSRRPQPSPTDLPLQEDPPLPQVPVGPVAAPDAGKGATRLFSGNLPAIQLETVGSQTVVVGKEATFIVRATNLTDTAVTDVAVDVTVPASAELKGNTTTNGSASYEPGEGELARLRWSIRRLEPARPEQLVLKLIPRNARGFELAATWSVTPGQGRAQIRVLEPKLEMKLSGPPEVLFGDTDFYTITVSNPGTGIAENVSVNLLPINPGEESPGQTSIGSIEPGSRQEIEIELTARQAGLISIRAEAFADGDLRAESAQEVRVRRAKLDMTITAPEVKYAGTVATYGIELTNGGDAPATNVQLAAKLPAGSKYVMGDGGGTHDPDSGSVSWLVGTLRPGESRSLEVQCVLAMPGDNHLKLSAAASGDLTASDLITTRVEALADLKLHLNDPKGPLPVGEDVEYEVRVVNRGTKAAQDVNLVVYFSAGLEPVSVDGGKSKIEPGQVVFDAIDRIQAGQEVAFTILARADRMGNHICRTELECRAPETRLANEETTRFYGTAATANSAAPAAQPREARLSPTPAPLAPKAIESIR